MAISIDLGIINTPWLDVRTVRFDMRAEGFEMLLILAIFERESAVLSTRK